MYIYIYIYIGLAGGAQRARDAMRRRCRRCRTGDMCSPRRRPR